MVALWWIGFCLVLRGRDAGIRTRDPLNPIQVRYQTAPRPDRSEALKQGTTTESIAPPAPRATACGNGRGSGRYP